MGLRLGIDGGGTKTDCILVGESGEIVASCRAEGCNPSVRGAEPAKRVVSEAIAALLAQIPACSSVSLSGALFCMAGGRLFWRDFAAGLTGLGHVVAVDDSLPVLELALGGGPGLVLHAGTGSFVAARAPLGSVDQAPVPACEATPPAEAFSFGVVHYAGGLGWRFGDSGSGYDIGRRAVGRGLLELQGWMPPSGIGRLLQDYTGLEEVNAISRDFNGSATAHARTAGLAPAVLRLAESGNTAAGEIAIESVEGLLALALKVVAKLFPETSARQIHAGLSGPILTHPILVQALKERSSLMFKPVAEAPIEGVRRLLLRMA